MALAFYCFLFRRLKLGFDLLRGGGGDQTDHHADQQRGQEGADQGHHQNDQARHQIPGTGACLVEPHALDHIDASARTAAALPIRFSQVTGSRSSAHTPVSPTAQPSKLQAELTAS